MGTLIRLLLPLLIIVLSIDLLCLYYAGVWYDPIRAIERPEIVLLYVLAIGGIIDFAYQMKHL